MAAKKKAAPKRKAPEKKTMVCSWCNKEIHGRYEEITTRRQTKLVLCAACVKKGL